MNVSDAVTINDGSQNIFPKLKKLDIKNKYIKPLKNKLWAFLNF